MKVTADDIAQLLANSPPRLVPAHVAKAAKGGGAWALTLFGLLFGGFGLFFVFLFFPWRVVDEWRLAHGSTRTASGIVTDAYKTSLSVNKQRVFGYVVDYAYDAGGKHTLTCYTTGQHWATGDFVTVNYLASDPGIACIPGARLDQGGTVGFFVLIFPLVGFPLAGGVLLGRSRTTRILREGIAAEVDVLGVDATGTRVNYQTVYKITVSSAALAGGQPVVVRRYKKPDVDLAMRYTLQKQPVFILYDPRKPSRLIFPEALIDP
ncbi:MAG TPA: DUF3592 domain-containing protein [Candidatus Didemnitutus sp.]|nr:DUF3592 domain-containing protein [Candidatus Didemnitutus sp.]